MNSSTSTRSSSRRWLASLAGIAAMTSIGQAAVTVQFGETEAPSANVFAFYDPVAQDEAGWLYTPDLNRVIGESFVMPEGMSYYLDSLTMKLAVTLKESFAEASGFTIDFYELPSDGSVPVFGSPISSQAGTMQPTIAEAPGGSYFTFHLDTSVLLEAGKTYSFVLAFDEEETYNWLGLAISANNTPNPAGGYAWQNSNGEGWIWLNESRVYYLQGTAVPEPSSVALMVLAGAGFGVYCLRRKKG